MGQTKNKLLTRLNSHFFNITHNYDTTVARHFNKCPPQNPAKTDGLSLYSTRTQNTWRRGLVLGSAPDARILRYPMQNIPTCWYILALPPEPTPDASQWNIGGVGSSGIGHVYFMYISCIFHVVCASFSALATRKLADANPVSSGIWALIISVLSFIQSPLDTRAGQTERDVEEKRWIHRLSSVVPRGLNLLG